MGDKMYKIIYKSTRKTGFVATIVLLQNDIQSLHSMYAICYIAICDIRTNCDIMIACFVEIFIKDVMFYTLNSISEVKRYDR